MAYVSTIISGVASLGVLIGLITGIFFLVLTALRWISRVRESLYEEELRRQKRFLINKSYLVGADNSSISQPKKTENGLGSELNGSNLLEKIDEDTQSNEESTTEWNEHKTELEELEKPGTNYSTVKVREVIEKMVETMIGGPLDGTTVGQMSTHSAYLDMFTKYHNLLCRELARLGFALHLSVVRKNGFDSDSIDLKQCNLKRLIKKIVSEAMALPNIKEILCGPKISKETETDDFKNKSYEDILATAILNKIIENYQNKKYKENESGNPKRHLKNRKIKNDDDEYKSDGDWSDTSRSDQLSLTIEEYIEEVTTALNGSEDERSDFSDYETTNRRIPFPESGRTVVDAGTDDENSDLEEQTAATELITSTSSWEENWLFQKKRLRSTPNAHHPVPVPMLVPNPSEDFRALVGGVDADDLSDMSDCSDSVLEDMITTEDSSKEFLSNDNEAKTQNYDGNEETEENISKVQNQTEKDICDVKEEISHERVSYLEVKDTQNAVEEEKLNEQTTDDVVVVEDLTSPVLPEVLSQKDRDSTIESIEDQYELIDNLLPSDGAIKISTKTETDDTIRCRIAEREKEKWLNPILWNDNPYSIENIENKEHRKKNEYFRIETYTGESIDFPDNSSSEFLKEETEKLRFSRDYYINASKHPSGMSSPSEENEQVSRHSYEAFSTLGRRRLSKNSKLNLYPDIADGSAKYFSQQQPKLFPPLQSQIIRQQHFSQVFKTSPGLNVDPPKLKAYRKYRYGSHTLKLRPKTKEIFTKPSLEKQLSQFEQKSLREDLKHSLLRARGASPNFILNPVFKPDGLTKTSKKEATTPFSATNDYSNKEESQNDSEFGESELIKPSYRHKSENPFRISENTSRVSQESGYGSDSLDYSSDSLEYWRLTPPKTPEVVESSFVSIMKNRKNKDDTYKVRKSVSNFY